MVEVGCAQFCPRWTKLGPTGRCANLCPRLFYGKHASIFRRLQRRNISFPKGGLYRSDSLPRERSDEEMKSSRGLKNISGGIFRLRGKSPRPNGRGAARV